jgi:hypothetical protein
MSARRRGLVPLLCVLAALVLLEVGARVVAARVWRPLPPFGDGPVQREWLARAERELAAGQPLAGYSQFDATLGWSTRPGYAASDGSVHVNARGLRATREHDELPPPGVRRVIACGESFTFCEEVADAEAWTARMEALAPALEVLNYGVGGYGTDQALLRVSSEAHGPADALLVGLMLENIGRNVNRYRPLWYPSAQPAAKPRYVVGEHGLEFVAQPYATRADLVADVRSGAILARLAEHEHWSTGGPPGWLAWSAVARLVAGRRAYAARDTEPLWRDVEGEPFRTTLALLEAFRGVAQQLGGARLVVLVFPTRVDLLDLLERGAPYWAGLPAALDARGIEWLDLSTTLAEAARAPGPAGGALGVDALYGASHFTPRANELVALAVLERLWPADPGR